MEWKIGEIRQVDDERYQCIEGNCAYCSIKNEACGQRIINDVCKLNRIFKKLEKVGEPYDFQKRTFQTYKLHTIPFLSEDVELVAIPSKDNNTIEIEIKQNKEDMEEKKTNFVEEIEALCKRYNMSDGVRADFISEIKEIIKDKDKIHSLKPFDLEAAKQGKPVCTRDGRKARIICFDAKFPKTGNIVTLVEKENGEEVTLYHYDDWHCSIGRAYALMMLPEKKEGWVNVYNDSLIYDTKEEALNRRSEFRGYIDTVKICWEE